jgi:hypothetical protein
MLITLILELPRLCGRIMASVRSRAWQEQTDPRPSPSQVQQAAEPGVYALLAGVDRR